MPNEKSKLRRLAGRLAAALPSILKRKKKSVWYKVVREVRSSGKMYSACPCAGGTLEYSTKKFTKMIPGSFGIYVFGSLAEAKFFAKINTSSSPTMVYECTVKGRPVKAHWILYVQLGIEDAILKGRTREDRMFKAEEFYYHEVITNGITTLFSGAPPHSYTVPALKLKKLVLSADLSYRDI